MKDLAKKEDFRSISKKLKHLEENQEELQEDQPPFFSKSFSLFISFPLDFVVAKLDQDQP